MRLSSQTKKYLVTVLVSVVRVVDAQQKTGSRGRQSTKYVVGLVALHLTSISDVHPSVTIEVRITEQDEAVSSTKCLSSVRLIRSLKSPDIET